MGGAAVFSIRDCDCVSVRCFTCSCCCMLLHVVAAVVAAVVVVAVIAVIVTVMVLEQRELVLVAFAFFVQAPVR